MDLSTEKERHASRVLRAYRTLLCIIAAEAPAMVALTFLTGIGLGAMRLLSLIVNRHVFDDGLALAAGELAFQRYLPTLIAFVLLALLPPILEQVYIFGFVEPRALLILRTAFKRRMLQKLARMKYEHLESETSMEVIDKAYHRAESSARHLFPMYVIIFCSNLVGSAGILTYMATVKWWLPLTILAPSILEMVLAAQQNFNIYLELESYWNRERQYEILGGFLRARDYLREMKLFGSARDLIEIYRTRLNARNREYEGYYFKHLKQHFVKGNITKLAKLVNVLLILALFVRGQLTIGLFITLSLTILTSLFESIAWGVGIYRWSGYHINFFDYYQSYLELSEEVDGEAEALPDRFDIEFRDVWFRYPGTDRDILKGLSFHVADGEKLSIVGKNGEGKTTMIKLLLRLFEPDRGEILVGGRPIDTYARKTLTRLFGPVFQDFNRYAITLRENIGVGFIDQLHADERVAYAAHKGKVDQFAGDLPQGYDTVLGREFEGGVDVSGGQWQRIAIARAFMGDKPVLLLDEPTSQLDPIAESQLYREFAEMADGKTAIFITHRLASTMITDRILVIQDGVVTQEGTHDQLMAAGGLYAEMFEAQKHWYRQPAEAWQEVAYV
ncbi:MAG: ABC transporter ATP-binding protein [Anaerolineae bacterium]|nr:ABC transporter ATP-binding protein [Anaerolineae bacterium]